MTSDLVHLLLLTGGAVAGIVGTLAVQTVRREQERTADRRALRDPLFHADWARRFGRRPRKILYRYAAMRESVTFAQEVPPTHPDYPGGETCRRDGHHWPSGPSSDAFLWAADVPGSETCLNDCGTHRERVFPR